MLLAQRSAATIIEYHGYANAVELKRGNRRAVLCPQVGGRPLEFSLDGKNALYLDEAYPDCPTLIGGEHAKGATLAFKFWCDRALHPAIMRVIILDLFAALHEKDKAYFRETREKRFGVTLEEFGADPEKSIAALRKTLDPVRQVFTEQTYIGGAGPSFADYILFGSFQWPRIVSPKELLEPDDPLFAWRERLLDAHGGLARRARAAT